MNDPQSTSGLEAALLVIANAIKESGFQGLDKYEEAGYLSIPGTISTGGIFQQITIPTWVVGTITVRVRANVSINVGASTFSEYHFYIRKNGVIQRDAGLQAVSTEWLLNIPNGAKFTVKAGDTIDFLVLRNGSAQGSVLSGDYEIIQMKS